MKLKFLLVMVFAVSSSMLAQNQISGIVVDEANVPLPGASVVEKGTTNGVQTGFDGDFNISVSNSEAILVVSYLGYENKEVTLNGASSYTIQLNPSSTGLDEVVVIGYGSVKKSDLTGAVASISNETLTEQRKTNVAQAIQGRVAGVDVRTLNSKPGAPLSFQIRGNTVITANQGGERDGVSDDVLSDPDQPLFVVDGVFFDNINVLNPADIDQIDVLKDVSATAIYGARGANGVIIITTKGGVEGRTSFTYDSSFGVRSATNLPDFLNGPEYLAFVDDVLRARQYLGTDLSIAAYNNVTIDRTTEFLGASENANIANGNFTDWADLLRKTGIQTSHTLGISGGENGFVYNASLGYLNEEGVVGIEEFERYNISASVSKKITDKLTLGVKTYLSLSEQEQGSRELFRSSLRLAPTVDPFDDNGDLEIRPDQQDDRFINPFFEDQGAWTVNTRSLDVIANVSLNYKANDWLSLRTQFSPNVTAMRFGEFRGLLTRSSRDDPSRVRSIFNTSLRTSYAWDNIADLNFDFKNDHNLKATIIGSLFYDDSEGSISQVRDFDTDAFLFFNNEGGDDIRDFDTFNTRETLASFATRLNYTYKDKYLLTLTGRVDSSSKLADGNKTDFFPSAAFAWRASEESFLKKEEWLNNLKLRVSYGESGNDNTVSPFQSFAFLQPSNFLFGDNAANGQFVETLPNSNLGFEVSREFNLGFDLGVLNNRVNFSFEYYNKTTDDAILSRNLSFISGFGDASNDPNTVGNFGSVRNRGVEITLNTVNVKTEDFSWKTNINFATNDNEILELFGDTDLIPISSDPRFNGVLQVGAPIDAVWTWEVDGIYGTDDVAEAESFGFLPGQYRFVDQNGDGVINQDDRRVVGSQSPDWIAGMTNTFNYKDFELNVQVNTRQGTFGHSEFLQNFSTFQGDRAVFNSLDQDYWTPNNQNAEFPSPEFGEDSNFSYFNTSFDFVRIGNIGLGYSFPQEVLDKMKLSKLKLSLDVQNPFTFTDYEGPDPETGLQNSFGATYAVKTFLFGLKVAY